MSGGKRSRRQRSWQMPAVLVSGMVLAAVLGFVFVSWVIGGIGSTGEAGMADKKTLGDPTAPVTLVVYSDFQ